MGIGTLIKLIILVLLIVAGINALCYRRIRHLGYVFLFVPIALLVLGASGMFGMTALGEIGRASRLIFRMPSIMILVVVGIAALVALLSNRQTRPVGFAMLAAPIILGGLAVVFAMFFYPVKQNSEIHQIGHFTHAKVLASTQDQSPPVETLAVAPEQIEQKDGQKVTKSIIRSLAKAFGETYVKLKSYKPKKLFDKETLIADKESPDARSDGVKPKPDETPETTAKNQDGNGSDFERINQMVEVLSGAVQQELPADVEVDHFTALRALGKLLGRVMASEQREDATYISELEEQNSAVSKSANGLPAKKTSAVDKPADQESSSDRPDWVESAPRRVGDGYQVAVVVGPYTTRLECDKEMEEQLRQAVAEYAALYLGDGQAHSVTLPDDFLRGHLLKDQWEEPFRASVGPMVRLHARLLFDNRVNTELKAALRCAIIEQRLWTTGAVLGAVLAVVSIAFIGLNLRPLP